MRSDKYILLLALVLSLTLASSQSSQQDEFLQVGQSVTGFASKDTHFLSFQLLRVRQIKDNYLFFIAAPIDKGNTEHFIVSVYPAGQNQSLIECSSSGLDACFLEKNMIQENVNYVVSIDCQYECEYTFTSSWGNFQYLQSNDYVNFYFSEKGKAQIYRVTLAGEQFDELKILLGPKSRKTEDDEVKIYGIFGEDTQPTQQKYDFISQTLWGGVQAIFLQKKDIKNEKLTLLIVGQSQIIYSLSLETMNGTSHMISQGQKQIMSLDSGETEYLTFKLNKNSTFEQLMFGFSFMNGKGTISFYSDQQFKIPFEIPFINYMQDIQYYLNDEQIKKLKQENIYAKVQTDEKDTVFMVKYQTRGLTTPVQFTENIYEFVPIVGQKLGFLYFDTRNFRVDSDTISTDSQIDFSIVKASGQCQVSFRICTVHAMKCINPVEYKSVSKPVSVLNQGEVGMKTHYKISIKEEQLMEINAYERRGILLIEFKNLVNQTTVVAGHYAFGNAIQDLRLSHPIEQILEKGDQKVFKYINTDSNIQSVRFHVNQIKGSVTSKIYKQNPLKNKESDLKQIDNTTPIDTQRLYQPLYLVINANQLSIVGLSVQQVNDQQKITALSLTESVPYTIRIQPGGEQSLKLNPLYSNVNVNFKSTGSIMICSLNKEQKCKQQSPLYTKQGSLQFTRQDDQNIMLVANPNQWKFVQLSLTYHSITGATCDIAQIGQIYQENVASGSCFIFLLNTIDTKLFINTERIDIGPFQSSAQLCGIMISQQMPDKLQISTEQMDKYCKSKPTADRKVILRIYSDNEMYNVSEPFKVQFHAEYQNSIIDLPDGLAYRCEGRNKQGMLRKFYYKAINMMDTKILLRSYEGNFKIFGKIIDKAEKLSQEVNSNTFDFQTTANNFIRNPASVVTKDMFKNDNCEICSLLLAVYADGNVGTTFDYSLEIVQNQVLLKDNTILENTLEKGSVAFYEYTSIKNQNCNLIIETSDHNKECTKIYLSDRENPNESNNIAVENGNKLVFPNCLARTYYIAVQATSTCSYGIEVTNSLQSLVKIERGKPINVNLNEGEIKFMMFRHISTKQFKIITMNQYGAARIYATPFSSQIIESIRQSLNVNLEDFAFKSVMINSLLVKQTDNKFCSDCYYIAAIKAESKLISTAILADSQTITELSSNKILSDQLKQNSTSHFYLTNILTGSLPLIVYQGKIQVNLMFQQQKIKEIYSEAKQIQQFKFDFNNNSTDVQYTMSPITLDISCLNNYCFYSVGLKDETVYQKPIRKITGNPQYIYINKNQNSCVNGYLEQEDSKIILSVGKLQKQKLKQIDISIKIDGKDIENVPTEIYSNIMIISPSSQSGQTSKFQLCMSTTNQDYIFVIVQQGENVKILPENEDTISFSNSTYIVYPNGQLLIDVFDCTGDATFKYSTNQINDDNMTLYSSMAMPEQPHALKISSYLPTYLQFQGQKSIVRWMDFDPKTQQGVGYEKYGVGNIKFYTQGANLNIEWGSLKKKLQTKTNVKATSYTLFISSDEKLVKYASQCEVENSKVLAYHIKNTNTTLDKQLTFTIPKADLEKQFSKDVNMFMIISADMELVPPTKSEDKTQDLQYYRFFYSEQEIPSDIFKGDYSSENSKRTTIAIVAITLSVIGLAIVGIGYLVFKKLVPLISRMKNRVLLQEAAATQTPPIQSNERIVVELS